VDGQVVLNPEEQAETDAERGAVHKVRGSTQERALSGTLSGAPAFPLGTLGLLGGT
jgi:hypothetical protein